MLGYDMVAASNTPTPEQIHSMLDRYRTSALPFSGSSLLTDHYSEVPLLSVAWGIGKISVPLKSDGIESWAFIFQWRSILRSSAPCGGRARYASGSKRSPPRNGCYGLVRRLKHHGRHWPGGGKQSPSAMTNPDMRDLLNSTDIEHKNDRAVVTATLPVALLQKMVTAPNSLRSLPKPGAKQTP